MPELEQVSVALHEKRRELVLKGKDVSKAFSKHGIDKRIFQLKQLNFLEISDASLKELPEEIRQLLQLKNLNLTGNILSSVPSTIGELSGLKTLDLSRNQISALPESIGELTELYSLDVSNNQLVDLPESVSNLEHLTVLNVSNNEIEGLSIVWNSNLSHLSEILASQNCIVSLEHEVYLLTSLKKLDLCNNNLTELPADLASCGKLKELMLKGNPLKDTRLAKLVRQDQGMKPIMENIRTRGTKSQRSREGEKEKGKKKKGKRGKKAPAPSDDKDSDLPKLMIDVLHFKDSHSGIEVHSTAAAREVRPYIVCCVVENINLEKENNFKNFIKLQTRLHDGPLCGKRTVATIATHDTRAIQPPLLYDARPPQVIKIVPLMKSKPVTAEALMAELMKEADEQRKAQKRNTVSGVHKYLHLLWGHEKYPCLMNTDGHVLSFPPITNADVSKISRDTKSLFVEVTSSKDMASCKAVLDELIREMLNMELGVQTNKPSNSSDSSDEESPPVEGAKRLTVRQVRVLDEEGTLKVVYPSRTDLCFDRVHVIRD